MYKVLIADDEAIIREGLGCIVDWEALGYEICGEAANGEEALNFLLKEQPDVALLDIRMPKMLGLDVIREAKKNGYNGKIIILSGYSDFKYAQEAIRYGIEYYLTKPTDEDELQEILLTIRESLDQSHRDSETAMHYRQKAYHSIVTDILLGKADYSHLNLKEMYLDADVFQVVIYEKYSHKATDLSYSFSDLLRVTNQNYNSYDNVTIDFNEVLLLKGNFAIQKFNDFLERYQRDTLPQKDSPLDTLFLTYGHSVSSLADVSSSYQEALRLLERRFFCEHAQHTMGYEELPSLAACTQELNTEILQEYADKFCDYLQAFNRNMLAETLQDLNHTLFITSSNIEAIKLFLADLYLQIKERIHHLYNTIEIPFPGNSDIIKFMESQYYLYEINHFFEEQFELIMNSIGNSSRDSVLDDILHYINHNYSENITLENIAPLFGYNSSYLGKIFSKKMGENFNSYVDHIRIDHSKQLLLNDTLKVYQVAEKVGYRNVDYFHIKFKKYVGQSPAEFRKKNKTS